MTVHRILTGLALAALLLTSLGCSGAEYAFRSGKPNINGWTETTYESSDYTILGPVEAEGTGTTVIGVFGEGVDGQGLLWEAAREKYGDEVTGIKDITSSSEWLSVIGWIYARVHTTYRGIAVKEN